MSEYRYADLQLGGSETLFQTKAWDNGASRLDPLPELEDTIVMQVTAKVVRRGHKQTGDGQVDFIGAKIESLTIQRMHEPPQLKLPTINGATEEQL